MISINVLPKLSWTFLLSSICLLHIYRELINTEKKIILILIEHFLCLYAITGAAHIHLTCLNSCEIVSHNTSETYVQKATSPVIILT